MDEVFSLFIDTVGEPMYRQEVPLSSVERYRGKLPELLLSYWIEHGWCGYGNGIFWMVNPQEYELITASWLAGTELETLDNFHVIVQSAFGDLFLWGEKTGQSLTIDCNLARYTFSVSNIAADRGTRSIQSFLLSTRAEYLNFDDLFEPARKKLGTLQPGEIYGFVPALTFGGPCKLSNLEKVTTMEHLILLSQICPLTPYSFSDF